MLPLRQHFEDTTFFCYNMAVYPFQNNPYDLDPFCKMDLDLWDCFGREKPYFIADIHKPGLHN